MERYFFRLKKMTVGYGGVPLIRDMEISLEKGKILTLIGPNGAGKSTVLKSIIGQLPLLSGAALLGGDVLNELSEKELSRKVSIVLTERIRPEMMTARDVVATGRYPYTGRMGILSPRDKEAVRDAMALVHVTELAEKDFLTLSDGQRQRVMLARALAQEPKLLILDEPTSYLDIRHQLEFLSLLQQMAKQKGLTVIMSLHELDFAERISDLIVCLRGEFVERAGPPDTVFQPGYISRLYGFTAGSFEEATGRVELQRVDGPPEAFVIAGGGSGIRLYRKLQREGVPFATGILWENDQDTPVANDLASLVIREKAFQKIRRETVEAAMKEIDRCGQVFCTLSEFGELNRENEELLLYAKKQGKVSV